MKTTANLFAVTALLACASLAQAAPVSMLPETTLVSATCNGPEATVSVTGATVKSYEKYDYGAIVKSATVPVTHRLKDGRRFNFLWDDSGTTSWALLTPEMMGNSDFRPSFLGPNIGVDCSYESPETGKAACAFVITCGARK